MWVSICQNNVAKFCEECVLCRVFSYYLISFPICSIVVYYFYYISPIFGKWLLIWLTKKLISTKTFRNFVKFLKESVFISMHIRIIRRQINPNAVHDTHSPFLKLQIISSIFYGKYCSSLQLVAYSLIVFVLYLRWNIWYQSCCIKNPSVFF